VSQIVSLPYLSGVPRFYDISGMTHDPEAFQMCIDVFVKRYSGMDVDAIAGLDARGFVLGPPIALALKKPFIMIRKKGKLPNAVTGEEYRKEYQGANATGGDELCISRTAIKNGARVLVIDDLVATGVSHTVSSFSRDLLLKLIRVYFYTSGHSDCRG
jgi:adenine phosphoribosyltransferase